MTRVALPGSDVPDPVGPVTSTSPRGAMITSFSTIGRFRLSIVGSVCGVRSAARSRRSSPAIANAREPAPAPGFAFKSLYLVFALQAVLAFTRACETAGSNPAPATNFQAKFGGETKLAVTDQLRKIAAPNFKSRSSVAQW